MKKGAYLAAILRSQKTVFTFKDISLLWQDIDSKTARVRINYYVKNGQLCKIRRGFYAKNKDYSKLELATRIFTPSYVSFETVLGQAGITFQYYSQIFVASYLSRAIVCDAQNYAFRKIKDNILTNSIGVEHRQEVAMATKERAFLDTIYINKDYHFDNLLPLDWEQIFVILPIYQNRRMTEKVKQFYALRSDNAQ
ncbi:MAG: hypothetical protein A2445_01980 [Candidatus Jacksonbacteria bacterium RIFOXYC2_FULL_44_29]|nr:MAG: hypothetical protein UV19_C0005G0031 [Parcubacteria group bacterium GW2011_GWA2_42_28]KKT55159.1 MAG: hypothetical protein UW45_C0009G0031 [Parcubacteria group bacterium GW2011_GWC2_44_22]OGY75503.1 MAG: hypothetical protein A2240_03255 [Candidatus Jacksonbacteria bacterium RIFOXYA2_FULL_43_12]OGY75835.1 MAG: hypothetical protein A2295_00175 [Candidatus Jacksonbacteria bacterium RIFOXYB2_FULL_44_15]OGY77895.1 MAG: hypothetical protein A2445_01980 [Candidatus Jacksonbacteria bacterium RI